MARRFCTWGGCDEEIDPPKRYCDAHLAKVTSPADSATAANGDLFGDAVPRLAERPTYVVPVKAHTRTVVGTPPTGLALRERAHEAHNADEDKARALVFVREQLRALYARRCAMYLHSSSEWFVTSDDAWEILRDWKDAPASLASLPTQAWMGSIFRAAGWRKIPGRMVKSDPKLRPLNHGALIACWMWTADAATGGA